MKKLKLAAGLTGLGILAGLIAWQGKPKEVAPTQRPNIIVIMADDMGYSDLGCFGGEINTPNINYLANNGVRYTNFYNTSRCCPTRASLLTGLYNHQAGIGKMTDAEDAPGYQGHLGANTVTIAEVLKTAGYNTAMSGKWHVSNTSGRPTSKEQLDWLNHHTEFPEFSPISQYPTSRGFDKFFGTIWGVVDFFDPFSLVSGTKPITKVPKDYYHTDAINDTAVTYIKGYAKSDKPFFLYVAENAPHWPLHAKPADIAKYKDTYKGGWDAIREARYNRMVKMGLIDPKTTKLTKRFKDNLKWENNPDAAYDAEAMAVHAAMIDCMDQGIGRIIQTLKDTKQLDNTLILVLSDNGASSENAAAYGPGFDRPNETRDGRPVSYTLKKDNHPGDETTYASIGQRWANVANTPYAFWKQESYEGGVKTPLIAFWPKGIKAKKGSFNNSVGHVMDFMSTFVEIAGGKYPTTYQGRNITPTPGVSMVASFTGKQDAGHKELFNEHFGARYARVGDWKITSMGDTTWHLYNIANDLTETTDLRTENPAKVKELAAAYRAWATTHNVLPKPGGKAKTGGH
ncbi:arylsulfatase [Mucilaginibacter myungsuensis]|uniref:Arylsulfatase n=1 Tax=Mucilaginibacter myungsuensis TaxID=649104 RepID=A0A929KTY9_9SPHI|nr:arylsulfatase [Mucilaginibacter myungsuensis]MBE9661526.1 arylsulfatase [Mucilaginibacter myungsuensis]MDN3597669.1 arylsulfatase [Mucilaginibacter myungsuensis]